MTNPAKPRPPAARPPEPDTAKYRLVQDRLRAAGQGGLRRYLRRARAAGQSYSSIASDLKEITNEPLTYEAVRQWCIIVCAPAAAGANGGKES